MRLTGEDRAMVAAAIRAAEATTDGEIAMIVSPRSDAYHDVVLHWALLAALLPLAIAAAWPSLLGRVGASVAGGWGEAPSLRLQLTLLLGAEILVFLAALLPLGRPSLRMRLIPAHMAASRVRARALALFRAGVEGRTASRTGVLLYLSLAERRAEIVADAAIHAAVPQERWGEAMAALLEGLRAGRPGDGIAAAIARIGAVLAAHFPHTGNDPNELPDRMIEL